MILTVLAGLFGFGFLFGVGVLLGKVKNQPPPPPPTTTTTTTKTTTGEEEEKEEKEEKESSGLSWAFKNGTTKYPSPCPTKMHASSASTRYYWKLWYQPLTSQYPKNTSSKSTTSDRSNLISPKSTVTTVDISDEPLLLMYKMPAHEINTRQTSCSSTPSSKAMNSHVGLFTADLCIREV